MKRHLWLSQTLVGALLIASGGCAASAPVAVMRSAQTSAALSYHLTPADEALLDEVQRGCFAYFWNEVGTPAQLAKDRKLAPVASIAAVGFQLASLPIGIERGWIAHSAGEQRARTILKALLERTDNKKFGIYMHFPDMNTGGPENSPFGLEASTVDHALLLAGALVAAQYFGGEVAALVDRMAADSNWRAFAVVATGRLSMGWKPKEGRDFSGPGEFIPAYWTYCGDEERLVYFLAAGAPNPDYAVPPESYYRLERVIRPCGDLPPCVASWPGSLFTYFFSHCWIDYRALGADDPGQFGVTAPRVDWFENSRRAVLAHRQRCIEEAGHFRTLAADRWGLSACVGRAGYIVPEIRPSLVGFEHWHAGTVAPYAAGSAIMFTPRESLAALRAFRNLHGPDGNPLIWQDPQAGGYGLADAFNLDQGYVAEDYVGIDEGPLLLAIENVRSGLIWKLFMQHPVARCAVERLRLK